MIGLKIYARGGSIRITNYVVLMGVLCFLSVVTTGEARVEKMKNGKSAKEKDLTTLHYNGKITLTGIPLEA